MGQREMRGNRRHAERNRERKMNGTQDYGGGKSAVRKPKKRESMVLEAGGEKGEK